MVEISLSGSGEGRGPVTGRGYSTAAITSSPPSLDKRFFVNQAGLTQAPARGGRTWRPRPYATSRTPATARVAYCPPAGLGLADSSAVRRLRSAGPRLVAALPTARSGRAAPAADFPRFGPGASDLSTLSTICCTGRRRCGSVAVRPAASPVSSDG